MSYKLVVNATSSNGRRWELPVYSDKLEYCMKYMDDFLQQWATDGTVGWGTIYKDGVEFMVCSSKDPEWLTLCDEDSLPDPEPERKEPSAEVIPPDPVVTDKFPPHPCTYVPPPANDFNTRRPVGTVQVAAMTKKYSGWRLTVRKLLRKISLFMQGLKYRLLRGN